MEFEQEVTSQTALLGLERMGKARASYCSMIDHRPSTICPATVSLCHLQSSLILRGCQHCTLHPISRNAALFDKTCNRGCIRSPIWTLQIEPGLGTHCETVLWGYACSNLTWSKSSLSMRCCANDMALSQVARRLESIGSQFAIACSQMLYYTLLHQHFEHLPRLDKHLLEEAWGAFDYA